MMANVFIEEICLFVTLLAVFTCFLPSCSLLALGRFHHHTDTVRGLKIDVYKTSLKATELICMMTGVWWAVAKEHLAVTFVAASAKNREQHFTPLCVDQKKKKIPVSTDTLTSTLTRFWLLLTSVILFVIIAKSKMLPSSVAVEPQKLQPPGPEQAATTPSFFPFHHSILSLIDSLCDDGAVRESEGWSGEESMFLDVEGSCGRAVMKK